MTGRQLGPFEIVGSLGEGGMGAVYRARDTRLQRDVAIKVLLPEVARDPERLARFRREAQMLAALNHPNVAHIHGIEESGDDVALVMELVEGDTLADRIARGPVPLDEALPIARQLADALEAAHDLGIVHRDLKPANIKVRPDGTVKVLDFGLAKAVEATAPAGTAGDTAIGHSALSHSPTITSPAAMTRAGVILGTAAYMSPEQARGRNVDRRADIWAFGCVVYEMLTGRRAFPGDDVSITLAGVLKDPVAFDALPDGTPAALHRLLRRCLEKDPKRRLSAIADARIELDDAAGELLVPMPAPARAPARASALSWAMASVLMVLLMAALAYRWQPAAPPDNAVAVRFTVSAPPGVPEANYAVGWYPRLSPDGRLIAFAGRLPAAERPEAESDATGFDPASSQDRIIWIRRVDARDATPLTATKGMRFTGGVPFWSPDSRWLAVVGDNTLFRVNVETGSLQKICEIGRLGGGAWSGDGTIVYSDVTTAGLHRVPASGGTPELLARPASQASIFRLPTFLPDNQHIIYQVTQGTGPTELHVRSIAGGDTTKLTEADSQAVYAGGQLLFMRKDSLFAQPFDERTLQLSGDPHLVVGGVYLSTGAGRGAFDASANGTQVYRPGERVMSVQRQLTWFNRSGQPGDVVGDIAPLYQIRLAPDERRVAASLLQANWNSVRVAVVDARTGIATSLPEDSGRADPVWAPDSQSLAFNSLRNERSDLFRRDISTQVDHPLYASTGPKFLDDWSSDGRFILFHELSGLFALPLDGTQTPVPLIAVQQQGIDSATFSHDGRWFAYALRDGQGWSVWVASFPDGGHRQQISSSGGGQPLWRGDDREIFYLSSEGKLMVVGVIPSPDGRSLDFTSPQLLFQSPISTPAMDLSQYAVARDGKKFLFIRATNPDSQPSVPPIEVVLNWKALGAEPSTGR